MSKNLDDTPFFDVNWEMSIRLENVLKNGFSKDTTISEIRDQPDIELLKLPNMGRKTLTELRSLIGQQHSLLHDRGALVELMREAGLTRDNAIALMARLAEAGLSIVPCEPTSTMIQTLNAANEAGIDVDAQLRKAIKAGAL